MHVLRTGWKECVLLPLGRSETVASRCMLLLDSGCCRLDELRSGAVLKEGRILREDRIYLSPGKLLPSAVKRPMTLEDRRVRPYGEVSNSSFVHDDQCLEPGTGYYLLNWESFSVSFDTLAGTLGNFGA